MAIWYNLVSLERILCSFFLPSFPFDSTFHNSPFSNFLSTDNLAQKKSSQLNKYLSYHTKLEDLKKQLLYLSDEDAFRSDSLNYVEKIKQDSIKAASISEGQPKGRRQTTQTNSKYIQPKRPIIFWLKSATSK